MDSQQSGRERERKRPSLAPLFETTREISPYIGHGFQLAASILVFLFLGRWVDSQFGTYPVFMIIGAFIGGAGGMISFIRAVLKQEELKKRKKKPHEN